MNNLPVTFGPPLPLEPLLMPGTSLKTRSSAHLNSFGPIPLMDDMGLVKAIQAIALIGTHLPTFLTKWESEISKHSWAESLQAKLYYGPTHQSFSEANLLQCDIISTSYNTITQEFKQTNTSPSCVFQINSTHIILNEAQ
ncbi:hypothetical protein O181_036832 [Austropuccinia psidii MF-1]|uniref:Uncharacterized protein n=1 Tax=Austropuccinia psidii MF-1 TaxID=1389203 RepID=A0A9Q3DBG6_9BASI|nr:hypothetical protein [Austropuccinia psidii MF-1]